MATRSSEGRGASVAALAAAGAIVSASLLAQAPPTQPADGGGRASARIRALQRETEALARQESSLLGELRKLEVERQMKTETLAQIERERAAVQADIAASSARAESLERTVAAERPEIARRVVRLYTLGRAGFWRLLFDVDSLRSVGRAYRTAAALDRLERDRVLAHQRTLASLAQERATLTAKADEWRRLESEARRARAAIDRAVASRTALVASIDARRDLNAQMVGELRAAQERLEASVSRLDGGPAVVLPLKAFRGALPWPAAGAVRAGFKAGEAGRNGLELSLPPDQPVRAVHEGKVAYADTFTGYGRLVILEHGADTYSLYGYLSDVSVEKGAVVAAQAPLGRSGTSPTGKPALYFELRVDGRPVDPVQWLTKRSQDTP
jgi:septal ring factor EnvC (AmiA/AmiB activator)